MNNHLYFLLDCNGKKMNRIIGGERVDIGEFPDQISLEYRGYHICGGSIMTNYHVITAASCVVFDLNCKIYLVF